MFVSVTRLHLRSKRFFLPFLLYTFRSGRQLRRSPGFRGGALGGDAEGGSWTITEWDADADMRAYRNNGPHAVAMRKLLEWCDEASFAHYVTDGEGLPAPHTAFQRLAAAGKTSKVNHPSALQSAGHTVSGGPPKYNLRLRPK